MNDTVKSVNKSLLANGSYTIQAALTMIAEEERRIRILRLAEISWPTKLGAARISWPEGIDAEDAAIMLEWMAVATRTLQRIATTGAST